MNNRIPWWPELINKKKGHDIGMESTTEEYHDYEKRNENVGKVLGGQENDENDVYYDPSIDLEDLDNGRDAREPTTGIAKAHEVDEDDESYDFKKRIGESMDALKNGKSTQKKIMDDICHDLVTCIVKNSLKNPNTGDRDNNASDSGIDEDEEYHDSLENIETVIESEGSFSEVPNDTILK